MYSTRLFTSGLLALFFALLLLGYPIFWGHFYDKQMSEHDYVLERVANTVNARLDKYDHLPELLSQDQEIIDALLSPNNSAQIDITNRHLENVNNVIQGSDTYLIDQHGNTIATSNWRLQRSFLGNNYAWRPYFQEAILGTKGHYFALGFSSGERGYYFSYPVFYAGEVTGVVVVKMELSDIERDWNLDGSVLVATDPNGVVFMSNRQDWLYKSLTDLEPLTHQSVVESRQYRQQPIESLGLVGTLSNTSPTELADPRRGDFNGDYFASSKQLPGTSLTVRVLTPKSHIFWQTLSSETVLILVFSVIFMAVMLTHHRAIKKRQLEAIENEAKQRLEFQVMERTSELQAEIAERIRAEDALKRTQNELIQAAKLAVLGQMSASISHELNNPLAAIRSFADNGRRFLSKQKLERVDDNLARISSLTERMAAISTQLRSFAKKADGRDVQSTNVANLINESLALLKPALRSAMVKVNLNVSAENIEITTNRVQLEQVLINLLNNSIQAVANKDHKLVDIKVEDLPSEIAIIISDTGEGVAPEYQQRIFEPFYTTKTNGLGLGLSISQQIINDMGGSLTCSSSELGGAQFTIQLPKTTETKR